MYRRIVLPVKVQQNAINPTKAIATPANAMQSPICDVIWCAVSISTYLGPL